MKKIKFLPLIIVLLLTLPIVFAKMPAASNGLNKGKGKASHLYLFEKDPSSDWTIVEDGAWGKMSFKADDFVFNGHGLEDGYEYALIYYPDPWPGIGILLLGTGVADEYGDVHIMGEFDFSSIPAHIDDNANPFTSTYEEGVTGAKIWLVLYEDLMMLDPVDDHPDLYRMIGWNPTEYLFEYDLINKVTYQKLELWEKDPSDWAIVYSGASGIMYYIEENFFFEGYDLTASTDFSLIYYPDPWPGEGLLILGSDTTDSTGNIAISEDFEFSSIPIMGDENDPGAKIWLVLSNDVGSGKMVGWNPTEYLFENNLI